VLNKVVHKISSLLLALFLLVSTTSWKVEKHFCMGHLVDISFFLEVGDCGTSMSAIDNGQELLQEGNTCCSDEIEFMDGQEDLRASCEDLNVGQPIILNVFTSTYIDLFFLSKDQPVPNKQYPPPILVKDIQLLDQVYLI